MKTKSIISGILRTTAMRRGWAGFLTLIALIALTATTPAYAAAPDIELWHNLSIQWSGGTTVQQSNSSYTEDDSIPAQYTQKSGNPAPLLREGETHTIRLKWDATAAPDIARKFIDYLTTYNATESTVTGNAFDDLTCFSTDSSVAIPTETDLSIAAIQQPGTFLLCNIVPSSVTFTPDVYVLEAPSGGKVIKHLDVQFTVADDGDGTPSENVDVGIAFGVHLASEVDWGQDNGAGTFPGASPQVRINLDSASSDENININPSAVVPNPRIVIVKDDTSDSNTVFDFTGELGPFTLQDPSDNTETFLGLTPDTYTVSESDESGFDLDSIVCVGEEIQSGQSFIPTFTVTDSSVDITVDLDQQVTCTFTNIKQGSIKIIKNTVGGDGTFVYAGSLVTAGFSGSLTTVSNTAMETVSGLSPASYVVTETDPGTDPGGFEFTSLTCEDPSGAPVIVDRTATIDLAAGENVTCTYTNTKEGSITIEKDTVPDDAQDFAYTTTGDDLSGFTLDDDADGTESNTTTFSNLLPGTRTVTEGAVSGFVLTGLTCTGASSSSTDLTTRTATIDLAAGENVTCTYTNTKDGKIIVEKQTLPDGDSTAFTFTGDVAGMLSDGQTAMADVAPGTYSSTETVPTGWALTDLSCDDANSSGDTGTATATFNVEAGETVTCTFTNTKQGPPVCLLIIDEDGIDNGISTIEQAAAFHGVTPDYLVNDDMPVEITNPPLRWNEMFPGDVVLLPTGQVDDEGWFALPPPDEIRYADDRTTNLTYEEWIAAFVAGTLPQDQLDKVRDVMPIRNQDLVKLIGSTCTAVVYDSDISMNYEPINANLQGARYGLFTFTVLAVEVPGSIPESQSSTSLYPLWVQVESPTGFTERFDVVVHDHEPDSIQITGARYQNGVLTVFGESNFAPDATMTVSVDGPDQGTDRNIDPTFLEVTMSFDSGDGRYEYTAAISENLVGRRVLISTDEGGSYHQEIVR